jgi:hypothetical protein
LISLIGPGPPLPNAIDRLALSALSAFALQRASPAGDSTPAGGDSRADARCHAHRLLRVPVVAGVPVVVAVVVPLVVVRGVVPVVVPVVAASDDRAGAHRARQTDPPRRQQRWHHAC